MRRRARPDGNQTEIVEAFRRLGWYVHNTSRHGDGFPDLVIAKEGRLVLVEVKDGSLTPSRRVLTPDEHDVLLKFHAAGVYVQIVATLDDVAFVNNNATFCG